MASALFRILKRLDDAKIHYVIGRHRPDTVDVTASVVGQRIEISVFEDGRVEVSRFFGHEDVEEESVLDAILAEEERRDAEPPSIPETPSLP